MFAGENRRSGDSPLTKTFNVVTIEFFTIGISVRLSDRSLHGEEQKQNSSKIAPSGDWKPGLSDLQANALPTELGRNLSFVCFMHQFTCWTLFISRINRAWLYKGHADSGWQLNVDLAQLVKHWPEDPEVLVSKPTGGNFWRIFFCSSLCKDLSDCLTETHIVKNSNFIKDYLANLSLKKNKIQTGHNYRKCFRSRRICLIWVKPKYGQWPTLCPLKWPLNGNHYQI